MKTKKRLAVIVSHPIQYQAPLFAKLALDPQIDLTVYFCWDFGIGKKSYDEEFGRHVAWDIPVLHGYRSVFLKNYSLHASSTFWGQINPGVFRYIKKEQYDAVMIFGWNSFTNWLAFCAAFVRGVPVLLRGENPLSQERYTGGVKQAMKRFVLGTLFKYISAFLYIGEENKKFYEYYGVPEGKLFFAPYAVDNARFMHEATALRPRRNELRNSLGVKDGDTVFLFMGKLIDKKRPFDLLRAFEQIKQPNKALLFVGDGALRPRLEQYVKERSISGVYFLGFKNQTKLPQYYALSDVLVLPSGDGETWGLAVNEAMCFGLPVVVSDMVGCAPDLVRNDENGFIVSLGDISALSTALGTFMHNPGIRKLFGEKSRSIIEEYSYEKDVSAILDALEKCSG